MTDKRFVLGFAGGVAGMTDAQLAAFTGWVRAHADRIAEFRCGASCGADEQATAAVAQHTLARIVAVRLPRNRRESPLVVAVAAESVTTPRQHAGRNPGVVEPADIVAIAPPDGPLTAGTYGTFRAAGGRARRSCCSTRTDGSRLAGTAVTPTTPGSARR
jgi:hypothetical protein